MPIVFESGDLNALKFELLEKYESFAVFGASNVKYYELKDTFCYIRFQC